MRWEYKPQREDGLSSKFAEAYFCMGRLISILCFLNMRVFAALVAVALNLCVQAAPLTNSDLDAPGLSARLIPAAQNLTARSTGEGGSSPFTVTGCRRLTLNILCAGGFLNLDNSSPYTWKRSYVHSYQMNCVLRLVQGCLSPSSVTTAARGTKPSRRLLPLTQPKG